MKQILGVHIGTETIGWALVRYSTSPRIVNMGTRIFSSFVTHLGEGDRETSNAAARTQVRNARKLHLRKTYRKHKMLSFLTQYGLCPLTADEFAVWRKEGTSTHAVKMKKWFALNPYELRAKGVTSKLSKLELGRILYHMTQRRGKILTNEKNKSKAKILLNGLPAVNRLGIHHADQQMTKQQLGEYLNTLLPKKGKPYSYQHTRVRNRYLERRMYHDELKALFKTQKKYHAFLTEPFIQALIGNDGNKGILFYQRPAQYRKLRGVASTCPYEKNKKSMWQSHPLNEWYNVYCWLDSIRLYGKPLDEKQRKEALKVPTQFAGFMFKKVRIALGVEDTFAFNYEDSAKIYLTKTISHLARNTAFGQRFLSFSDEEQHELWHDLHFYSDKALLTKRLQKRWKLPLEKAKAVAGIKLKPGFGMLSMKAARAILGYLKEGHAIKRAIILGGVTNAIGTQRWNSLNKKTKENITYFVAAAIENNKIEDPDWICDFANVFDIQLNAKKLYLIEQHEEVDLLPVSADEDRSIMRKFKPVAQKPIFELRKLINNLIKEYGSLDQINFALSNEIKINANQRKAQLISKKIRELELPKIHDAVLAAGQNPTHTNLFKYKLWLEWNKICPYTNTPIPLQKLFTDEISIVYIHPWERFFNDSDRNKALCMTFFKENIINKTPYEYFSTQPSGVWERVKTRVLEQLLNGSGKHGPYLKYKHFTASNYVQDSVAQEFDDRHHMAFKVKKYLSRVADEVFAVRGNTTSSLRRKWGISNTPYSFFKKTRGLNSREPAVVALVTALNTPSYLKELRNWNRYEPLPYRGVFPTPWKLFTRDAIQAHKTISISIDAQQQVVRRMAQKKSAVIHLTPKGKLHKDSYYAKRKSYDGTEAFHIRKPINSLTTAKQVSKIVDKGIRELVYDQIDLCGGFIEGKIPKNALVVANDTGWETKIFLPNKSGDKVPVRSVRMRENVGNAVQLSEGENKYVNPRKNHHVLIYLTTDNTYQEHVVTFWEAVRRRRNNEPLYQLPSDGRMIITTLHINDCFILGLNHKEIYRRLKGGVSLWENVYRIQRISSKYYEFRQVYDLDTYDQTYPNYIRILNFGKKKTGWLTHKPFKVSISVLGQITPFYKLLKVPDMH